MRILVVEDESDLRDALHLSLRGAGFAVDVVADLPDADFALSVNAYDCTIFDRRLPTGDSLPFVRDRRAAGWRVPVLFLTGAMTQVPHLLEGLASGDDYLTKPFDMAELVARVRRLSHSGVVSGPPPVLRCGDLELDPGRREVRRAGTLLMLTKRQFAVLELLMRHHPRPVSVPTLIDECWDIGTDPNAVQQLMTQLRKKLHNPPIILNVKGVGYRLAT
ncbi:response regulator transcription factor [Fodinicola acaciae]|uniref:response regulator transcription factor n=1 Tax=Fodinicola acaciae TaxID=2681555 RepID=UPI0013D80CEA|nr:response regulator transcription factor [Fodinicola acaciae]